MPDYSDSDEELGAYIYRTSHTAKLLREKATARNNEFATKTNTKSKRKIPPEVENISVSSEPKQRAKKKRNIYTYTCCHEEDQRRTSRTNLPNASKTASLQTEDCSGGDLAGEAAILNTKEGLLGTCMSECHSMLRYYVSMLRYYV